MKRFDGATCIRIDFIDIADGKVSLTGEFFAPTDDAASQAMFSQLVLTDGDSAEYPLKALFRREKLAHVGALKQPCKLTEFACEVPLNGRLLLRWKSNGRVIPWRRCVHGTFSPLTERLRFSYACSGQWILRWRGDALEIAQYTFARHALCELAHDLNLLLKMSFPAWRALVFRAICAVDRMFTSRPLWLFSDRVNKADDNARAMFEYACGLPEGGRHADFAFALEKGCEDWDEMRKVGPVVNLLGFKYKIMFVRADFVISAYRTKAQRMPFSDSSVAYCKSLVNHPKFIFLRHGISKDDMSHDVGRPQVNARIMVSAAPRERDSILDGCYMYTAREVKLLGMPRYDKLYDAGQKTVTFMPTWRRYLVEKTDAYNHELLEEFKQSSYLRNYKAIFNDRRLIEACERLGFRLRLMMHPNMTFAIDEFSIPSCWEVMPPETRYRDVFATSGIVVTDYSSVFFDVAYLKKPIVFFHADRDEFFALQYEKGYFSYERDGFGEVETTIEATVSRIIEYMESGCKMKPEYRKRVDDFFAFTDRNNCKRVYDAILEAAREDGIGGKV